MAVSKTSRVVSFVLAFFLLASSVGAIFLIIKQSNDNQKLSDLQQQALDQQAPKEEECKVADNITGSNVQVGEPLKLESPASELQITDTKVGTGEEVRLGDCITVNYRLNLADGSIVAGNDTFASGEPIAFDLIQGGLIEGWTQGLPGMKVGGLRRLVVPASLAYGDRASGSVPANSDLVFDIEVLDTKH